MTAYGVERAGRLSWLRGIPVPPRCIPRSPAGHGLPRSAMVMGRATGAAGSLPAVGLPSRVTEAVPRCRSVWYRPRHEPGTLWPLARRPALVLGGVGGLWGVLQRR